MEFEQIALSTIELTLAKCWYARMCIYYAHEQTRMWNRYYRLLGELLGQRDGVMCSIELSSIDGDTFEHAMAVAELEILELE